MVYPFHSIWLFLVALQVGRLCRNWKNWRRVFCKFLCTVGNLLGHNPTNSQSVGNCYITQCNISLPHHNRQYTSMSVKYRSFNSSSTALWWFGPGVKHNCLLNKLIRIILLILLGNCSKLHFILSYWCITKIPAKLFNNHSWKIRIIGHFYDCSSLRSSYVLLSVFDNAP